MLSKGQFEDYITYFSNILKTRDELEDKYGLVLDGIYDDVYLIMDMVIDSNLTKEGRNLFWNTYYELNIKDSETLWEIVKNNYNYEPTE